MTGKSKYNVNELLEKKKFLEAQIREKMAITANSVTHIKETIRDRANPKNDREIPHKPRLTLNQFTTELTGMMDDLSQTKTAIQKYNAENVLGLIQERGAIRSKIEMLNNIKAVLPRDESKQRQVLTQDNEGVPVEINEIVTTPMFELSEVDKQVNEFAGQERRINTEIQRLNLDASISL